VIHVATPRTADQRGRTRLVDRDSWIRSLIEAVLFTAPGERVNRPDFGSGLMQLVFAGNDESLAAATQVTVQGALQTWLADLAEVRSVSVTSNDARLDVTVTYVPRGATSPTTMTFRSPA
jgi:phage baseplate assembly protein W